MNSKPNFNIILLVKRGCADQNRKEVMRGVSILNILITVKNDYHNKIKKNKKPSPLGTEENGEFVKQHQNWSKSVNESIY